MIYTVTPEQPLKNAMQGSTAKKLKDDSKWNTESIFV